MKTIIRFLIRKFLTPKKVAQLLAGIIADLLRKASNTGNWDKIKSIIDVATKAITLFNDVYADETIDKDDERLIAEAIENMKLENTMHEIVAKIQ